MSDALVPEALYASPNALAPDYSRFDVANRLLLTGHSHQAWPDRGFEGQVQAWLDAARFVDEKWDRAFEMAERVRRGYARLLDDPAGDIALGANTHELVVRFLSALDVRARPRLVTTDGEFHTLRRQLARLGEAGLDVVRVPAAPAATLSERLAAATDERTAAVLVSAVLYETASIVPGLGALAEACEAHGAELLVDVYHAVGPRRVALGEAGLARAWVVGGGYKYLQLGEGNCFLRLPPQAAGLRPVITGWYAEFDALAAVHEPGAPVPYGAGASRFAGATYDPTSHYRAARVLRFFAERGLTPAVLEASYRHQVALLAAEVDALDLPEEILTRDRVTPLDDVAGFLALESPRAGELQAALTAAGVASDSRGRYLRLGPAPYLSDGQLREAVARLDQVAAEFVTRL
jgi:kynureninase